MYFLIFQSEVILKLFLYFNEFQPIQHMLINVLLIKKCISTKLRKTEGSYLESNGLENIRFYNEIFLFYKIKINEK